MSQDDRIEQFDIRGQVCPSSLLIALQGINQRRAALADPSLRLVILTDNRDATATIPQASQAMGYEVSVEKASAGHYRIEIGSRRDSQPANRRFEP